MRTEAEMYELILNIARNDERIRAVYMNGSRTNPNVPKDIFQDYDLVYVVTDTSAFIEEKKWIDNFGESYLRFYKDNDEIMFVKEIPNNMATSDFCEARGFWEDIMLKLHETGYWLFDEG